MRPGAPLVRRLTEEFGAVLPGEEEVVWRPHSKLPASEGGLQETWQGTFHKTLVRGQGVMGTK